MDVVIQAWDFRPGHNFPLKMHEAMGSKKTILVLSPDYLESSFGAPEWAAAFRDDPEGIERKVVPIMVRECEPPGLLTSIVHIRLYGLEQEDAKHTLLAGLSQGRAKPAAQPRFPGAGQGASRPDAGVQQMQGGTWKPSEPFSDSGYSELMSVNEDGGLHFRAQMATHSHHYTADGEKSTITTWILRLRVNIFGSDFSATWFSANEEASPTGRSREC